MHDALEPIVFETILHDLGSIVVITLGDDMSSHLNGFFECDVDCEVVPIGSKIITTKLTTTIN